MNLTSQSPSIDAPDSADSGTGSLGLKRLLRTLAAAAIVLAGILVILLAGRPADKDYISYWSAGKLLIHRADPYSATNVLALEKSQGYSPATPIIMRNPPWALFLTAPLGMLSPAAGLLLWTLAAAGCIVVFLRLMRVPADDRVLAFLFAPALCAICSGQSSPFLLLGFSLFLYLHKSRPALAGASLLFMAIKPHLFLVFWLVLIADCIYRRRHALAAGFIAALTAGTAFAMVFDARIWQHYFAMLHSSSLDGEFFPTLSMLFRLVIDRRAVWLLFVPSVVGCVWAISYYARHCRCWDWATDGMLVMLVTLLVSPYGWFSDEIVLMPALAFALSLPLRRKHSVAALATVNCLGILILVLIHPSLNSAAYLWTPAAWLAWYLYATSKARDDGERPESLEQGMQAALPGVFP